MIQFTFTRPLAATKSPPSTQAEIRQLFTDSAPSSQGLDLALDQADRLPLDLPADSDTRLLGSQEPLLVTRQKGELVARDPDTGQEQWRYQPVGEGPFTWAASPDGEFVAVRQKDRIQVVETGDGQPVRELELPKESLGGHEAPSSVRFGPGHTVMADYKAITQHGTASRLDYNLAFYEVTTGEGPEVVRIGNTGHMSLPPVVSPSGDVLYLDDSYGLKAVDVGSDRELWQRHDIRNIGALKTDAEGRILVSHTAGVDVLDPETGKSTATVKHYWLNSECLELCGGDRFVVRDLLKPYMHSYGLDGGRAWTLELPEGYDFKQTLVTNDLIYATAVSKEDGYQVRLMLVDPVTGNVLAQSSPLGHMRHGLPLFQAENRVYLALDGGAIAFSPQDIQVDRLREAASESLQPASIEVGQDFVQVGGVRLKSRKG
ncbi:MAG: PQQ-binding-like beta-propeller repeat protein [Candidatus Eremiobacterota bacterium]